MATIDILTNTEFFFKDVLYSISCRGTVTSLGCAISDDSYIKIDNEIKTNKDLWAVEGSDFEIHIIFNDIKSIDNLSKEQFQSLPILAKLSSYILDELKYRLSWRDVAYHQDLSEEEILRFSEFIDLRYVRSSKISEDFIEAHFHELDLSLLLEATQLSEEFIIRHESDIDALDYEGWDLISQYQYKYISEDFLRRYKKKLFLPHIGECNFSISLSDDFILEYRDRLYLDSKNMSIRVAQDSSDDTFVELFDLLDQKTALRYRKLTPNLVLRLATRKEMK